MYTDLWNSDETLGVLVKHVTEKLCPVDFDSDDGLTGEFCFDHIGA